MITSELDYSNSLSQRLDADCTKFVSQAVTRVSEGSAQFYPLNSSIFQKIDYSFGVVLHTHHVWANLSTVNMPKKPVFNPPSTLRLPWSNEQGDFMQEHDSQKPRASQVRGSRSRIRHYRNIVKLRLHSFKEIFRKSEKNLSALMVLEIFCKKEQHLSPQRLHSLFQSLCGCAHTIADLNLVQTSELGRGIILH